ncbi:MAG: sulfotransferase family 2 domain-containing protein [Luteolibacter sp.]
MTEKSDAPLTKKRPVDLGEAIQRIQDHGFWFVDVPRTSSSSIRNQLGKHFGAPYTKEIAANENAFQIPHHETAQGVREIIGKDVWGSIFTFSFVRNPWDRIYSLFRFRRNVVNDISPEMTFTEYVKELEKQLALPEEQRSWYSGYYRSASDYLEDENGEIAVSFVGRMEDRLEALREINKHISITLLDEVKVALSAVDTTPFQSYYNEESRQMIERLFRKDIERFSYSFEDIPKPPDEKSMLWAAKYQADQIRVSLQKEKVKSEVLRTKNSKLEEQLLVLRAEVKDRDRTLSDQTLRDRTLRDLERLISRQVVKLLVTISRGLRRFRKRFKRG